MIRAASPRRSSSAKACFTGRSSRLWKGNDSNPSPGVEPASTASRFAASANQVEEGLQSCDFLVQGDSKCHECAGRRVEARRAGPGAIGFPYQSGQLSRGRNRPCLTLKYNFSGNGGCIGVLAVGPYEFCKFPFLDSGEHFVMTLSPPSWSSLMSSGRLPGSQTLSGHHPADWRTPRDRRGRYPPFDPSPGGVWRRDE